MQISERDLTKLAILLNKTIYSLDFPEKNGKFSGYADKTLTLVGHLGKKYPDASILPSIRDAIQGVSEDKVGFYTVSRDLLRMVNQSVRFRETPSEFTFFGIDPVANMSTGLSMRQAAA